MISKQAITRCVDGGSHASVNTAKSDVARQDLHMIQGGVETHNNGVDTIELLEDHENDCDDELWPVLSLAKVGCRDQRDISKSATLCMYDSPERDLRQAWQVFRQLARQVAVENSP